MDRENEKSMYYVDTEGQYWDEISNKKLDREGASAPPDTHTQVSCLDYMLACAEYDDFLQLVADFKSMDQWDLDDDGGCARARVCV